MLNMMNSDPGWHKPRENERWWAEAQRRGTEGCHRGDAEVSDWSCLGGPKLPQVCSHLLWWQRWIPGTSISWGRCWRWIRMKQTWQSNYNLPIGIFPLTCIRYKDNSIIQVLAFEGSLFWIQLKKSYILEVSFHVLTAENPCMLSSAVSNKRDQASTIEFEHPQLANHLEGIWQE